jgi:hypothetical protein
MIEKAPVDESMTMQHYFLLAGSVAYRVPSENGENTIGVITLNGIITTDNQALRMSDLGKAQKVLQHHFRLKTNDSTLEIVDVVLVNVFYLGFQSPMMFNDLGVPIQ